MRLLKNLKARILESIITWSEMGKQTAQAKEVYSGSNRASNFKIGRAIIIIIISHIFNKIHYRDRFCTHLFVT